MRYTLDNLPERNLDPPEGKFPEPEECSECGNEFTDKHYHCFTHLESTEDLRDYAHEKVECLDRLIGENRSLNAKIDGGVETVKDKNSIIEALKGANKELIDLMNRLTYDGLGDK